jgi:hypothetical protein
LVGVAALFAYNQAQQGNDWRVIATQAGLAIGIILVIDLSSYTISDIPNIAAVQLSNI